MAAGEERYLPRREQGPVRKLARDYVDSRRTVGEFFVYFALVCLALTVVPVAWVQLIAYNVAFPLLIAALVVDSVRLSRQVKARVAQRYPGESTRGLSYYAITRGLQIRRLRIPKPAVKVGDRV